MAERYDLTAKVVGHGWECVLTWGGLSGRPGPPDEQRILEAADEQFRRWFKCEPQTSAVTVGPHVPEGDDDTTVG